MNSCMIRLLVALGLLWPAAASAQGVIPVALAQQSDLNGRPLAGALLYIYQVGTVATPQNSFQDFGLTLPYPWPLRADQLGRIPMFYLANGQVHARLTDASGVVQVRLSEPAGDRPSLRRPVQGWGWQGSVDPTTVFGPGDFKWRPTSEALVGWVKANGQSIGTAGCIGCTGRTNTDTQPLYIYLWANCTNAHCPVGTGRGSSAMADFNALKPLTLPDLRGRAPMGLDDMGAAGAGRLLPSNVTSGGGDNQMTPGARTAWRTIPSCSPNSPRMLTRSPIPAVTTHHFGTPATFQNSKPAVAARHDRQQGRHSRPART